MALVKRSNSKFWSVQFQINHITIIKSTRTVDRKVAERVAAKIRAETHEQLVLGQRKPLTVEQALERFIATKAGTPNYRNLRIHQQNILRHIRGVLPLKAVTSTMLEDYKFKRAEGGASPQKHIGGKCANVPKNFFGEPTADGRGDPLIDELSCASYFAFH